MKYTVSISVPVMADKNKVFDYLITYDTLPLWNTGMLKVLPNRGKMHADGAFETTNVMVGQQFTTPVTVTAFDAPNLLEMSSETKTISYWAQYELTELAGSTTIHCTLKFEPRSIVIGFAHRIIEDLALSRLEGDLHALKALLEKA